MAGFFNDIKNKALNAALGIADSFTPVLKESKFRETGFLTPEEFVAAGDFLTGHCPTWQWAAASNAKSTKTYLPDNKQFLLTKNVPCTKRCRHLMDNLKYNQEKIVEENTGDGGWVDTHYSIDPAASKLNEEEAAASNKAHDMIDENDDKKATKATKKSNKSEGMHVDGEGEKDDEEDNDDDDDDGEAVDMEEFDHNIVDEDETTVVKPSSVHVKTNATASGKKANNNLEEDEFGVSAITGNIADDDADVFIPTRTYDLHITYDNYYRTPRLWLSGYDENNKPLTIEQMYDDISEDHAKKTVTFENHPHIPGTLMASIHPCRHADVMKKLINLVAESGKELEVYNYLMIFLKFVQSVIPTIEYDYTRNFSI